MTQVLAEDTREAIAAVALASTPRVRRQLVRTMFAEIEGTIWGYKFLAVASHETDGPKLSAADLALAREESYELNEKGESSVKSARLRFASNVLFGLRLLGSFYKVGWKVPTSDNRWQSLMSSTRVRDRLMHPKALQDLDVTDAEVIALVQGYEWFLHCQAEVYEGPSVPNPGLLEQAMRQRLAR